MCGGGCGCGGRNDRTINDRTVRGGFLARCFACRRLILACTAKRAASLHRTHGARHPGKRSASSYKCAQKFGGCFSRSPRLPPLLRFSLVRASGRRGVCGGERIGGRTEHTAIRKALAGVRDGCGAEISSAGLGARTETFAARGPLSDAPSSRPTTDRRARARFCARDDSHAHTRRRRSGRGDATNGAVYRADVNRPRLAFCLFV